eukprot:scaffold1182_cov124-Isochrysis_galbana.AAC.14
MMRRAVRLSVRRDRQCTQQDTGLVEGRGSRRGDPAWGNAAAPPRGAEAGDSTHETSSTSQRAAVTSGSSSRRRSWRAERRAGVSSVAALRSTSCSAVSAETHRLAEGSSSSSESAADSRAAASPRLTSPPRSDRTSLCTSACSSGRNGRRSSAVRAPALACKLLASRRAAQPREERTDVWPRPSAPSVLAGTGSSRRGRSRTARRPPPAPIDSGADRAGPYSPSKWCRPSAEPPRAARSPVRATVSCGVRPPARGGATRCRWPSPAAERMMERPAP